jgi:hypothetical protein
LQSVREELNQAAGMLSAARATIVEYESRMLAMRDEYARVCEKYEADMAMKDSAMQSELARVEQKSIAAAAALERDEVRQERLAKEASSRRSKMRDARHALIRNAVLRRRKENGSAATAGSTITSAAVPASGVLAAPTASADPPLPPPQSTPQPAAAGTASTGRQPEKSPERVILKPRSLLSKQAALAASSSAGESSKGPSGSDSGTPSPSVRKDRLDKYKPKKVERRQPAPSDVPSSPAGVPTPTAGGEAQTPTVRVPTERPGTPPPKAVMKFWRNAVTSDMSALADDVNFRRMWDAFGDQGEVSQFHADWTVERI